MFLGTVLLKERVIGIKDIIQKSLSIEGVSGDFTNGVLQRLDEIIFYRPTSVFLMIGINEFFADALQ